MGCVYPLASGNLCPGPTRVGRWDLSARFDLLSRTASHGCPCSEPLDGQYLGYLQELKGSKKILLLPGEHEIVVRQGGYLDFAQKIAIQPGEKKIISVTMERDSRVQMPAVTAEIKLDVNPNRAAVFVDGVFIGHVAEFGGIGTALLVTPGKRKIIIKLPGYQTFETDIELVANQKSTIKTELVKVSAGEESSQRE